MLLNKIVTALAVLLFCGCAAYSSQDHQVCFHKKCYTVEIAQSPQELSKGLMFREEMEKDAGMLFIFSRSRPHAFWMKNTLIPLDMIWLDSSRRVVHLAENVPPCEKDPCPRYAPDKPALYVLELNAGQAEKLNLSVGDQLTFNLNLDNL